MSKRNEVLVQVRDFARTPFAFPGGYPKVLIMADSDCLCSKCAKDNYRLISDSTRNNNRDGWGEHGFDIHWEGEPLVCANCNAEIESAYGIPEE